jgi:enoyl-CoA hydratase/carnithine racemase
MTSRAAVTSTVTGAVATVTIDNPAKRNAMTAGMWRALPEILKDLQHQSAVRVLVLTGAEGTFCAGADINDLEAGAGLAVLAEEALASFPKPTVARVEGDCVGGGCQLALACDLRLAAPGARFGITPARLGVVYPAVSTARLVHTLGLAHAKWLLLTAELASAADALRMGLVHEVADDAHDLDARVERTARTLAGRSLLSQAAAKEITAMSAYGVDAERVHHWVKLMRDSGEAAEGAAAFLQRRPADFPWRP